MFGQARLRYWWRKGAVGAWLVLSTIWLERTKALGMVGSRVQTSRPKDPGRSLGRYRSEVPWLSGLVR